MLSRYNKCVGMAMTGSGSLVYNVCAELGALELCQLNMGSERHRVNMSANNTQSRESYLRVHPEPFEKHNVMVE